MRRNDKRGHAPIMSRIGTVTMAIVAMLWVATGDAAAQDDKKPKLPPPLFNVELQDPLPDAKAMFDEVRELMLNNYYSSKLGENELYYAAIEGMLRHASPPDNPELGKVWTAKEWERIVQSLQGVQVSLGIKSQYNPTDGALTVHEVLDGSPSDGLLQPLDRVLRIDGRTLKGLNTQEINKLILGEPGTEATLTIVRDIKVFEIKIKRQPFKIASVESHIFAPDSSTPVGYIRLRTETQGVADEVKKELARFKERKITRLIVDLRDNGGGLFTEALKLGELFLPKQHIILRTLQAGDKLQNVASANEDPFVFRTAVLVNGKTASSSEILAAALQDHGRAVLIGGKTFGKGVFEKTFELKNKYRVKFIIGAMYSPKGRSWQSQGLRPDIAVEQEDKIVPALFGLAPDQRLNKDTVLVTAIRWMTTTN